MWNAIEDKFRKNALYDGALLILSQQDALAMVEACRATGVPVQGIDGFFLQEGGRIMPSPEHSIDYTTSWARSQYHTPEHVYTHARLFLKRAAPAMGFEVTMG